MCRAGREHWVRAATDLIVSASVWLVQVGWGLTDQHPVQYGCVWLDRGLYFVIHRAIAQSIVTVRLGQVKTGEVRVMSCLTVSLSRVGQSQVGSVRIRSDQVR